MKAYSAEDIRNIALAGHGGRGKTTLAEAMLFLAGASDRLGRVGDGNTVMDYDAEEKKRRASVSLSIAALEWQGKKLNLLDTPGLFDFAGEVSEGVRAVESVLIVTAAGSGYDVGASKAFKAASARGCAVFFAVTRCDAENTDFYKTFAALREAHEGKLCPVTVPWVQGDAVAGYVDFLSEKAYRYEKGKAVETAMPEDVQIDELREIFREAVASADDALMEKFFGGEEFTPGELAVGLAQGVAAGSIYPVYACAGYSADAVELLLNGLAVAAPSAAAAAGEGGLACDAAKPLNAICFKTVADPFVGKMSFFKVVSGKITPDAPAFNARTGESERMGKIIFVKGGKQEDSAAIPAGDIGVVTKLAGFRTGDTLSTAKASAMLEGVSFPAPCLSMAVHVRKKGEEEKVAAGLLRLAEEDPTIRFEVNHETHEQVLSGLGEQHLDVVVSKLRTKFGVEVDLSAPRVAYRETIRKKVEAQGRHKKQSGGHGQFGDVYIRFEPCESESLVFDEEVVGGTVPKQYFPAVEKGLRECVAKGFLAGYPMVGVKAVLYFGSYHPVDSSEMAFKTAAHICFKNAMPNAAPTILEPIGTLKVFMPDENLGDIMGDITKRRGRVLGMGAADEPKTQQLEAEVPLAEMGDFATALRSVTAGRGYFSVAFARYEDAPAMVAQKVIEEAAKRK
ncbi:MAG: elongation factor G, partial [Oscillospiraceae bacterium]|nr:elongation factor G [Oscillospiraceae bacterium]